MAIKEKPASELVSAIDPLDRTFFCRNPRRVARDLLGKILVREGEFHRTARIVEVEAYLGENDPAAHAAAGNTARNPVLFGPPGGSPMSCPRHFPLLTSGPGRLAQAFGITRVRDNGCDLTSPGSGLWIGQDGFPATTIQITPRIGITKATAEPLRFILAGNPFLSGRKQPVDNRRPRLDKRV